MIAPTTSQASLNAGGSGTSRTSAPASLRLATASVKLARCASEATDHLGVLTTARRGACPSDARGTESDRMPARIAGGLVARVQAHEAGAEPGRVLHGTREDAHVIEGAAEREDPVARDGAEARLVAHDAAEGRRPDHRAQRLGADRHGHEPRRHRRRRAARRAAGRMGGIPGIARLAGMAEGEFGGDGLAPSPGRRAPPAGARSPPSAPERGSRRCASPSAWECRAWR